MSTPFLYSLQDGVGDRWEVHQVLAQQFLCNFSTRVKYILVWWVILCEVVCAAPFLKFPGTSARLT